MWPFGLLKRRRKKQESKFIREANKYAKADECVLCGRKMTSPCNSHVVPQFVLKGIAENGKVAYGHSLNMFDVGGLDRITGVNNAYTFRLICNDCDNNFFKNYEKPNNLSHYSILSDSEKKTIMCEMAIKAHLSHIQTKYRDIILIDKSTFGGLSKSMKEHRPNARQLDIIEHLSYIRKLKKIKKRNKNPFVVLLDKELDYQTKIATQTIINYNFDLKGNQIFDFNLLEQDNQCRYFYLMILPYKGKTRILFYIEKNSIVNVNEIIEQFNTLNEDDKLHFLFISLIIHDQQFYMAPSFANQIFKKDKKIVKLYTITEILEEQSRIKDFKSFKNYLLEKYNV